MENQLKGYPMSPQQKHVWSMNRNLAHSPYRTHFVVKITGVLDHKRLEKALDQVMNCQHILKTQFDPVPGVNYPIQVVKDSPAISNQDEKELLEAGVMGAKITVKSETESLLSLTISSMNMDHELAGFLQALSDCYHANRDEGRSEEELQYVMVSEWFNDLLTSNEAEEGREYWKQKIYQPALPNERDNLLEEPWITFRPSYVPVKIPASLSDKLIRTAEKAEVEVESLLLTVWNLLLCRLTQQDEITMGVYCDPRLGEEDLAGMTGPLGRYVPFTKGLGNDSVVHAMHAVQEERTELFDYHECFSWDLSKQDDPYFSYGFDFVKQTCEVIGDEIGLSVVDQQYIYDYFKVRLSVILRDDRLEATLQYDPQWYDESSIQRMSDYIITMFEDVAADSLKSVDTLRMLSINEQEAVLSQFNPVEIKHALQPLHQMFADQVVKTPHEIALKSEDQSYTYTELNQWANEVAYGLMDGGVKAGEIVGICLERSVEMIVGILGTMKSGAAYLPLDPDYPEQRLSYIIKDVSPKMVITSNALFQGAEEAFSDGKQFFIDEHNRVVDSRQSNPIADVGLEEPAYIIYTSGSTGAPKGVVIPHKAASNHMIWMQREFPLSKGDSVLQKTSFSFDASVWEIFAPLVAGATLMMAKPKGHMDPEYLTQVIQEASVTVLQVVPTQLTMLLNHAEFAQCDTLKRVYCGGEILTPQLQERFFATMSCDLVNLYGPTEACIDTTYWTCERNQKGKVIPIGKPIDNTRVYILDEQQQPVPIGVTGELYIVGNGLATGYLHRPELTEERFIHHAKLGRIYKTGDRGRYLDDGSIIFEGRKDHQVKWRGFRIELGEIEYCLNQFPGVESSIVIVTPLGEDDHPVLAAYLVCREGSLDESALQSMLRENLPGHMLPQIVMILPELPLTSNGKVDRTALPRPNQEGIEGQQESQPLQNETEELVAGLFTEILGVEKVGRSDDFFNLGGHSLVATQLVTRIRAVFDVEISLLRVFEASTVGALALLISDLRKSAKAIPKPRFDALIEKRETYPLSFAQQRLWFLDRLEPDSPLYNMPSAIRLKGTLHIESLEKALQKIIERHEALRTSFHSLEGEAIQKVHKRVTFELPVMEAKGENEEEREEFALQIAADEAKKPFNLEEDLLIRGKVIKLSAEDHLFILNIHHIVHDGWSRGLFVKELSELYQAFSRGVDSPLPSLAVQYPDFAVWQREWMQGDLLEKQLQYWRTQLSGDLVQLQLPTDRSRTVEQTFAGALRRFTIDEELKKNLKKLGQQEGATLFMVLLAAFNTLLYRYTNQEDIMVGSAIANRNQPELEKLIGFFVNTLVIRTDLSGNPSLRELLQQVRRTALEAYDHQDLPFEKLVEEICPERDTSHSPLFRVMFSLHNTPGHAWNTEGLQATTMDLESNTSKFDMNVEISETEKELIVDLEYNTDLFEAETITKFCTNFTNLLRNIISNPDESIATIPLLEENQRDEILSMAKDQTVYLSEDWTIVQQFEKQVGQFSENIAVIDHNGSLTYEALNKKANQLAHYLQKNGVRKGSRVAVCLERSSELIITLLAVVKVGGVYVPLDATYPAERLAFMMEDASPKVLITKEHLQERISPRDAKEIVFGQELERQMDREPTENLSLAVIPSDLAYIMYTSGSTGTPKGVCVQHQNVVSLVMGTDFVSFSPEHTFMQFAPISFDAATFEIWGSLLHGAKLTIFPPYLPSLEELGSFVKEQGITVLWLTAGLFHQMVDYNLTALQEVKYLLAGGDVLSVQHINKFVQALPGCQLVNGYGPTEGTTFTCCYAIPQEPSLYTSVPIGYPIQHRYVYIVDDHQNPVPQGVPGELYIGGVGVAKGYWNRPEITSERFVSNPFKEDDILYKTGDRVRLRNDGAIEFLGRKDDQVKIRGYRIEPGDIETAMKEHSSVKDVAVVARETHDGDKKLIAYIVPESEKSLENTEGDSWEDEQVTQWEMIFDDHVYGASEIENIDPTFNTSGWISSYTDEPIPLPEMAEWLHSTVEQILSTNPSRALEIGCGTGMLLQRIAPYCERYVGSDISSRVLQFVKKHLGENMSHVELMHRAAHQLDDVTAGDLDLVIMNSVVQYFSGIEYLDLIIQRSLDAIGDEGSIFIGDVRSYPLLETQHVAIELSRADDLLPLDKLQRNVQDRLMGENELTIDPQYFLSLQQRYSQIGDVEIRLKPGDYHNELSQFRYDVLVRVGAKTLQPTAAQHRTWGTDFKSTTDLLQFVEGEQPEALTIDDVIDQRIQQEVAAWAWISEQENLKELTVRDLREAIQAKGKEGANPADFYKMGADLGYQVIVTRLSSKPDGMCQVVFIKQESLKRIPVQGRDHYPGVFVNQGYANNPMQAKFAKKLVPLFREYLKSKLPGYMVPDSYMLLSELPLTKNGKVNRHALPSPEQWKGEEYVAPRNPVEELVAGLWEEILGREKVGVQDDFFQLGGHSLLATQVISRIRDVLEIDLPLKSIFEGLTIEKLAADIENILFQEVEI
ncbi:amino acid adenylation domain-containing protein [Marininema mesophilum]|uniref:Amino acid adenylation domain-containing protein n=1 Tax=Marininema mesophilum TaxID=1048340 RepID=A0A1H3AU35_9BACL|nr:non-ribosomal peptide synthetase [Marininema mesophilum]SDX33133.1 amino acid adenylation domain-containing protein [Marininema mesophilum]